MDKYTKEQVEEIKKRELAAIAYLKENNLTPAAGIQKVKIDDGSGREIFSDQLIPYLQDTKYNQPMVINPKDVA